MVNVKYEQEEDCKACQNIRNRTNRIKVSTSLIDLIAIFFFVYFVTVGVHFALYSFGVPFHCVAARASLAAALDA